MPTGPRTVLAAATAAACAGALALPAAAPAAREAGVSIMDDQLLLNSPTTEAVDGHMRRFVSLGADRLRVSAYWDQIAPHSGRRRKPAFDAADPNDPAYYWTPLDRVVASARRHGLKVMVSITTPAPLWATRKSSNRWARDRPRVWKPSPSEFALFAKAAAQRYGPYADQLAIMNEPNQPGWLRPQTDGHGPFAPHHYRRMVRDAFPVIRAAAPRSTILVGELAPSGSVNRGPASSIRPLAFLRAFGCVSRSFRRVRTGHCRGFKPARADVIGHHPYQFFLRPTQRSPERDDAGIGDGRRLLRFLDRLVASGGLVSTRGPRLDVHYSEFGYQTDPPDPYAGIPLARQDRYLQEAAYISWRTPRVRSLNQFRLTDGAVLPGGGFEAYREFQTGLLFRNFRPKPAYESFRHPFVVRRQGRRLLFWGQVRPGGAHRVTLERKHGGRWRRVRTVQTTRHGYWQRRIRHRRGTYRYRWGSGRGRTSDRIAVR
jgi:hypothetical protein